jgi:chemotaxis signal transduction protein
LEPSGCKGLQRILVVRAPITTCLVVDQVDGMVRIPRDQLQAPDAASRDKASSFVRGFYHGADQLTTVLDIEKLLESPEMRQFD